MGCIKRKPKSNSSKNGLEKIHQKRTKSSFNFSYILLFSNLTKIITSSVSINNSGQDTGGLHFILSLQDGLEAERHELESISVVKLVLELDPVETQGMEESRETFHDQQDTNRQHCIHVHSRNVII